MRDKNKDVCEGYMEKGGKRKEKRKEGRKGAEF
jgi:hypothetical protein